MSWILVERKLSQLQEDMIAMRSQWIMDIYIPNSMQQANPVHRNKSPQIEEKKILDLRIFRNYFVRA